MKYHDGVVLRFGVSRSHSNVALLDGVRRLVRVLAIALKGEVKSVVVADYEHLLTATLDGSVDFAWMPPLIHARATASNRAILSTVNERKGAVTYRSGIVVRADSPYKKLSDLRGVRAAWTDPNSAGGCVLPRLYLRAHGVDLAAAFVSEKYYGSGSVACGALANDEADLTSSFVNESTAHDLTLALNDIAVVYSAAPWRFRILAITESIASDGIVVGNHIDKVTQLRIRQALLQLHTISDGAAVLQQLMNSDRLVATTEAVEKSIVLMRHRMAL
jgi:phosphate/phosphite/phosphonate ABC transporter binding protein